MELNSWQAVLQKLPPYFKELFEDIDRPSIPARAIAPGSRAHHQSVRTTNPESVLYRKKREFPTLVSR